MRMPRLVVLAALSSLLLALSLPNDFFPWGNPAIGLIALAPLYVALSYALSYRCAYAIGAIFGGLAHGLASYWLWFFNDFRLWTLGSTVVAYMIVYGFLGMYLYGAIRRAGIARSLVFAMVWAVFEWAKSSGFLGYPWGLLAYSWSTIAQATQIAESTGVYGLSFSIAFVSSSLAGIIVAVWPAHKNYTGHLVMTGIQPREYRFLATGPTVVSIILFLAILAYGSISLDKQRTPRGHFNAVLVQQNEDPWEGTESESLSVSIALAREAIAGSSLVPDIILFSESTLRRPWEGFEHFYEQTPKTYSLMAFIIDSGANLFTGAPEILSYEPFEASNAVILIDNTGAQLDTYAKMHPVPFAEAIPFWEYQAFRSFIQNVVGLESGWVMGTQRVLFDMTTRGSALVRFAAPICFEDAFAPLCRQFVLDGAEILVNLSNDSWSKRDSAAIQHLVAARFRAIELRRTLVRSTNGGLSAVIGPDGRILDALPLFEATARVVSVPVYSDENTPYLRHGDWFVIILACILAGLGIILFLKDAFPKEEQA